MECRSTMACRGPVGIEPGGVVGVEIPVAHGATM